MPGNVDDLDLSVVGPGSEYLDFNLTEGDFYRVSDFGLYAVPCNPGDGCTTPVRSSLFVIALAGDYDIMVYRRGEKPWSQLSISAHVRLCGRDIEYQLTLADNEQNDTIASGLRVPFSKCHRKPQSAVQNLRVWQSTVHGGGASVDRMWYLADDNPNLGLKRRTPWWRVSLENTQIVQGLWLAGQSGPGLKKQKEQDVSAVVDVDSYNGQIFYVYNATTQYCYRENGVTCSKASGHRHGVLNTVIRSDNGALEVTVREIRPCFYEATLHVPLSTILQQGTLCAEDVWVVAKYGRLRLCEVELFTEPLPTVTQVSFDYGASGNESVGANVITTPVDYPGVRRLQENNETLRYAGVFLTLQEEVATSDRVIPRVVQALLVDVQTTTEGFFTGNTERVSFRMELRDGSCNFRDLSWLTYGGTCLYPRCDEQAWSNEYPVHLSFGMLQPGEDYTLVCFVTDPWGNEAQQEFTLSIPERTTPAPPSTQSTSQRPQTPAPVTQPPTQPRTTQSVEYYTRAPTVRTTAAASTSGSGRRLAERWLVRVRFTVEAYNAVQNKALLQRVGQLGLGESSVSSNFQEGRC
eukprot:g30652.t1